MGYAPDWNKGSMKKSGATPVKHGVTSRELFHGAKVVQKFEDGGAVLANPGAPEEERNIRGEKVGKYAGNDEIVKYRMNMTDGVGGKSLRYKDNPDMAPERQLPQDRPYESIEAIIDAKASKVSEDPKDEFIAKQVKSTSTQGSGSKPATKPFAQKAAEAKPYDPDSTAGGMGAYMGRSPTGTDDLRAVTAMDVYRSASDIAADDFMKRYSKKDKK